MKKILALTLCLGLVAPLSADAQGRGKGKGKDRDKDKDRKIERAGLQAEVNVDRGRGRGRERGLRIDEEQAQINTAVQPQINADVEVRQRGTQRDWQTRRGPSDHYWTYNEAQRQFRRHGRRDRSWWRRNYSRFALFGGGYYYWDRGYWYPAYGYDPAYNTYIYDEPIYGYNQLEPGRVLRNVQVRLRRLGYYRGAIDGLIGPMTRSALTRFQRDYGLPVTRRVDGPTLAALGLV